MFKIVVQHFGFLKHIPVVPHIYDALLKIQLFVFNRKLLNQLDDVENAVTSWHNVSVSMHKYGGTQFNLGPHELGHLHGNGLLDVLVNQKLKFELMRHAGVHDHHVFKNSGWISFWVKTAEDRTTAISILEQAYTFRKSGR